MRKLTCLVSGINPSTFERVGGGQVAAAQRKRRRAEAAANVDMPAKVDKPASKVDRHASKVDESIDGPASGTDGLASGVGQEERDVAVNSLLSLLLSSLESSDAKVYEP